MEGCRFADRSCGLNAPMAKGDPVKEEGEAEREGQTACSFRAQQPKSGCFAALPAMAAWSRIRATCWLAMTVSASTARSIQPLDPAHLSPIIPHCRKQIQLH